MQRIGATAPALAVVVMALRVAAWGVRQLVYACIGFGSVATFGASMWWGVPAWLVVSMTLGRLWAWWRRDKVVEALEALAVEAEKNPAGRASA